MVQQHRPYSHAIHSRVRSFSRAGGRLTPAQHEALEQWGPRYIVQVPRHDAIRTVAPDYRLDLSELFPSHSSDAPVTVEIGSGGGEAIIAQAQAHPHQRYIAVEVWETALAKIVRDAAKAELNNLRVVPADASQLLATALPVGAAQEVWTFFPDPWRKPRHRKRRLVSVDFAYAVARVLRPGGVWRLATDWADYAWQMRDVLEEVCLGGSAPAAGRLLLFPDHAARPDLGRDHWEEDSLGNGPDPGSPYGSRGGWSPRWEGRVLTRFEKRGIDEGRVIRDLTAIRTSCPWEQANDEPRRMIP